ncbi:hypothetical protein ABPG72_020368, partial [Tetrahymena utriculariae]
SNKIDDKGANAIAKGINSCNILTNLQLNLSDYETLLKSSQIINCRNIRYLKLLVKNSDSQQKRIKVKILALKIKRLVKLNIVTYY